MTTKVTIHQYDLLCQTNDRQLPSILLLKAHNHSPIHLSLYCRELNQHSKQVRYTALNMSNCPRLALESKSHNSLCRPSFVVRQQGMSKKGAKPSTNTPSSGLNSSPTWDIVRKERLLKVFTLRVDI